MATSRIHRAISEDGTQVVAHVHGSGPPLVLVPGGPADGEFSFQLLVPHLAEAFACYCISTRGKGSSADHPDHSVERLAQDICAVIESIDGRVGLFGHSSGAVLAMEATDRSDAVDGLALYEPASFESLTEDQAVAFGDAVEAIRSAVDDGRPLEGARIFFEALALSNESELAVLAANGAFNRVAPNLSALLKQLDWSGPPGLSDPELPARLGMPVLLLTGSDSHGLYQQVVRDLAGRFPDATVATVAGTRHLAPQLQPERVAAQLTAFFTSVASGRLSGKAV